MKFSVLMSVYKNDNPENFFRAFDSVTIEQITKPNQVVIVYDGEVNYKIRSFINKRIDNEFNIEVLIVDLPKNEGLAKALNTGLKYCKYDWVARMDADDVSVPYRFNLQTEFIKRNPECTVVGGFINEFSDEEDKIISARLVPTTQIEILKTIKKKTPINHVTVMFRKQEILKVGGYNTEFGKLEDYKLWCDLMLAGYNFSNIPLPLVNVRVDKEFYKRRGQKSEIYDWDKLSKFMFQEKLISRTRKAINYIKIRLFFIQPVFVKKIIYKFLLRKRV